MKKLLFSAVVAGSFLFVGVGGALATTITDVWQDPSGDILMNDGTFPGLTDYQYSHSITPPYEIGIDTLTSAILTISLYDAGNGNNFKYDLDLTNNNAAIQVNYDFHIADVSAFLDDGILNVAIHRNAGQFYFEKSSLFAEWTDGEPGLITTQAVGAVPEPATMFLLGTGLVCVAGAARRKKKNQA